MKINSTYDPVVLVHIFSVIVLNGKLFLKTKIQVRMKKFDCLYSEIKRKV